MGDMPSPTLGYATSDSSAFARGCWQLHSWFREKNETLFDSGLAFLCRDSLDTNSRHPTRQLKTLCNQ
jgi:hypothetical protein